MSRYRSFNLNLFNFCRMLFSIHPLAKSLFYHKGIFFLPFERCHECRYSLCMLLFADQRERQTKAPVLVCVGEREQGKWNNRNEEDKERQQLFGRRGSTRSLREEGWHFMLKCHCQNIMHAIYPMENPELTVPC